MARPAGSGRKRGANGAPQVEDVNTGLSSEIEVPEMALALQNTDLRKGAVVRYVATENRENREYGRNQRIHIFEFGADYNRARFSVWGAMQLDMKLRELREGDIIVLQYLGRDQGDRAPHRWSVRAFHGTTEQLSSLIKSYSDGIKTAFAGLQAAQSLRGKSISEVDDELPF